MTYEVRIEIIDIGNKLILEDNEYVLDVILFPFDNLGFVIRRLIRNE